MTHEDQLRIVQADNLRRAVRDAEELEAFAQAIEAKSARQYPNPDGLVNPELVRGIGVVSPPMDARVSERWRPTATRCVGTVDNRAVPSVRVTRADGSSEIRTVASFRNRSYNGRTKATQAAAPHRISAADLAPIGDANH